MDAFDIVLEAGFAAGSVWFYFHCVRPAFLWNRARWTAHATFAALSLVPAIVAFVAPQDPALLVLPAIAWIPLAIGWVVPGAAIRATGGVSDAKSDLDVVYGWLSPAADQLDVGDLEAARMQVDEARRHATPATMPYVELWDGLLTEELQRRMGRRVSRQARVDAINEEYARLVFAGDHVGPILQWSLVLGIAAVLILRLATIA